jgi:ABC-2 type transport system ATP-binding protein
MNAIDIRDLVKIYPRSWASGSVQALRGVSLQVERGEVFGFIGANGAGKSTTIKILTGAMAPTEGTVSLFGLAVTQPEARKGLGYVPENPSLPDYLTPLEVLQGALSLHKVRVADAKAHCMAWLEKFQIDHVANKTIRTFSKGMAQRTALAHALCAQPKLLILDEPLSGLDPVGRKDVVDILSAYKQEGGTIFLTSHVLHDVERLADRFGLIHQGELKTVKSPDELLGQGQRFFVRTHGKLAVEGMRDDGSGRWYGEAASDELWGLLGRLEAAAHVLIEVRPVLNLESAFMQYVRGGVTA